MMISIFNPIQATRIFIIIFFIVILISVRRKKSGDFFSLALTQELKGLAILAVIFSHIGYFLINDHRFLFPLSILAGVGVNLFLFLSGFGLTSSALKNELTVWQFYRQRLLKLFTPFWLGLAFFLLLDFFVLKITYPWQFIAKAVIGIFTSADLYLDLNSPLWYFTLILFYYLIFPWVFSKKNPWLAAAVIYFITYLILLWNPIYLGDVMRLYKVHFVAFPLGILVGWLFYEQTIINILTKKIGPVIYYLIITFLIIFISYFAYYSGVGQSPDKEQLISVITMLAIIFLFLYKKIEFRIFSLFGLYSYEIYLLHWPLVYRYDLFYKYLPGWFATISYLILFLALGWLLKKISASVLRNFRT